MNKLKIISWALYDLANTIFAANIVSLYFSLWVTMQMNAPDKFYILPYYLSMVLAVFILPFFGILSDSLNKHSLFLAVFTLLTILLTIFIGVFNNLFVGVVFFCFANLFNQIAGNVLYPALLPKICTQDKIARVSGLGVALGYIGTIIGLWTVRLFIKGSNYSAAFIPSALLFLLFSLPCLIFVKVNSNERKNIVSISLKLLIRQEIDKLINSFNAIKSNKMVLRFLLSIMLAINGINGVLINMGVYAKRVMGFLDWELPIFISVSTIFAIIGSLVFSFVVERIGPKRALGHVLAGWVVVLAMVSLADKKGLFWIIGPFIGILLSGSWVSSRPLIIQLAPKEKIGEFFGFTGLASTLGVIFSPPLWLLIITIFEPLGIIKYRIAVLMLAILILFGRIILQKVETDKPLV